MTDDRTVLPRRSEVADPTTDSGIELGQRWRDPTRDEHFVIRRTYRDNPINPTFQVEYESSARNRYSRGYRTVTLAFLNAYCERADA